MIVRNVKISILLLITVGFIDQAKPMGKLPNEVIAKIVQFIPSSLENADDILKTLKDITTFSRIDKANSNVIQDPNAQDEIREKFVHALRDKESLDKAIKLASKAGILKPLITILNLISKDVDNSSKDISSENHAVQSAAIEDFLNKGYNINLYADFEPFYPGNRSQKTLLQTVINSGNDESIRYLLKQGASLNKIDLHFLSTEAFKRLINEGLLNVNKYYIDSEGGEYTLLGLAVEGTDKDLVEFLLRKGSDPKKRAFGTGSIIGYAENRYKATRDPRDLEIINELKKYAK